MKKTLLDCCYKGDVKIGFEKVLLEAKDSINLNFSELDNGFLEAGQEICIKLREVPVGYEIAHVMDLQREELRQQAEYMEGLKENIRQLEDIVASMEQSASWKVTKPLRVIRKVVK